jgi:hypothetical protein
VAIKVMIGLVHFGTTMLPCKAAVTGLGYMIATKAILLEILLEILR